MSDRVVQETVEAAKSQGYIAHDNAKAMTFDQLERNKTARSVQEFAKWCSQAGVPMVEVIRRKRHATITLDVPSGWQLSDAGEEWVRAVIREFQSTKGVPKGTIVNPQFVRAARIPLSDYADAAKMLLKVVVANLERI